MSETVNEKTVRLDSSFKHVDGLFAASAIRKFYQANEFTPVWLKKKMNTMLADSLLFVIRKARTYGLLPQDYHLRELEQLMRDRNSFDDESYVNRMDPLLTDAFFMFTNHLRVGRISSDSLKRYSTGILPDSLQVVLLKSALLKNELTTTLESQEPMYRVYRILRDVLRKTLNSSDSIERSMLYAGIDIDTSEVFARVKTLEINMERWRWERGQKGRYIRVNIPSFTLNVVEDDSVTLTSRVIVGNKKNSTPELDGLIKTFTIYPYWHVPRNIAVTEMLPQMKTDSSYLQTRHYEVLDISGNVLDASLIDWSQYSNNNFPFMLRQKEGIHNALGLIKFTFENPYAVYLHDTNARLMFNREKRALSHGCVRVEKALELGRHLVKDNELTTPDDLDQYLQLQKQYTVRISSIPVHIRYFTCEVDGDSVYFLKDVYGRDEQVKAAVYKSSFGEVAIK